jgi:hypothetical protein
MKSIIAVAIGGLLTINSALAGDPNPVDQKWLTVVEKKVAQGDTRISTPSEGRVKILKEWAAKNGYSTKVTKRDAGYNVELSKSLAQK